MDTKFVQYKGKKGRLEQNGEMQAWLKGGPYVWELANQYVYECLAEDADRLVEENPHTFRIISSPKEADKQVDDGPVDPEMLEPRGDGTHPLDDIAPRHMKDKELDAYATHLGINWRATLPKSEKVRMIIQHQDSRRRQQAAAEEKPQKKTARSRKK